MPMPSNLCLLGDNLSEISQEDMLLDGGSPVEVRRFDSVGCKGCFGWGQSRFIRSRTDRPSSSPAYRPEWMHPCLHPLLYVQCPLMKMGKEDAPDFWYEIQGQVRSGRTLRQQ
jgi:hypothetical protein